MTRCHFTALSRAFALSGAALLVAPADSRAINPSDGGAGSSETARAKQEERRKEARELKEGKVRPYKASICYDGKVYAGGPNLRAAGCKHGFTTVSAWIRYDGKTAKVRRSGGVQGYNCFPDAGGPGNEVTWCGVVNDGARGRDREDRFMSVGVNGRFDTTGSENRGVDIGGEVTAESSKRKGGGGVSGGFSRGSSQDVRTTRSYWLRIDVRPDGTYELRGGRNA